jgi:hypothetical protein
LRAFRNDVVEIGKIRTLLPVWWGSDHVSKDHHIVEFDIAAPNELGTLKVVVIEDWLGPDLLMRVFCCLGPRAIIEPDSKPIGGNRFRSHPWVLNITVDGAG